VTAAPLGRSSVVITTVNLFTDDAKSHFEVLSGSDFHEKPKVYRLYEFNSRGRSDEAKGTVDGDTWTFDGESKIGTH